MWSLLFSKAAASQMQVFAERPPEEIAAEQEKVQAEASLSGRILRRAVWFDGV